MIVNLARAQNRNGTELTYTDNVSAHGACIVSNHPWQPGKLAEITSMLDQIAMRGKVVHCRKKGRRSVHHRIELPVRGGVVDTCDMRAAHNRPLRQEVGR
jgi:hypothetical protein